MNEKYVPEKRDWEQKSWLYEQYWGKMQSLQDVADMTDVSKKHIRRQMNKHGIPRRDKQATMPLNSRSPFSGFYHDGEVVPVAETSQNERERVQAKRDATAYKAYHDRVSESDRRSPSGGPTVEYEQVSDL